MNQSIILLKNIRYGKCSAVSDDHFSVVEGCMHRLSVSLTFSGGRGGGWGNVCMDFVQNIFKFRTSLQTIFSEVFGGVHLCAQYGVAPSCIDNSTL